MNTSKCKSWHTDKGRIKWEHHMKRPTYWASKLKKKKAINKIQQIYCTESIRGHVFFFFFFFFFLRKETGTANTTFSILEANKWLSNGYQFSCSSWTNVCYSRVLDSQKMYFQSLKYSPRWLSSCRNIKMIGFGWMFLFSMYLSYDVAFLANFLNTVICTFSDPC